MRGRAAWRVAARDVPRLWRIELKSSMPDMKMEASVTLRFRAEPGATIVERDVQYRYGKRWLSILDALFLRRRNEVGGHSGLLRAKQIIEECAANSLPPQRMEGSTQTARTANRAGSGDPAPPGASACRVPLTAPAR